MAEPTGGITITEFQLIVALLGVAGTAFAGWLYRHDRWFRDRVFPVIQVLTGKSSGGEDADPTSDGGLLGETDDRLTRLEEMVEKVAENQDELQRDVKDLSRTQKRHNRQTEGFLRRIAGAVDDVDLSPGEDEPLFRGGGGPGNGGGD
jgi:hypothetical protein